MKLIYINKYIFIKNTYFYIVDYKNCNYIIHYIVLFTMHVSKQYFARSYNVACL